MATFKIVIFFLHTISHTCGTIKPPWWAVMNVLKVYFIQCTIYWDKTQMLKKSFGQKKRYKKCLPFSFTSSNSSLFSCDSYISWSTRFVSQICGFSIFGSVSFLLKFVFLFNKMHELFDFKTSWFPSKLK